MPKQRESSLTGLTPVLEDFRQRLAEMTPEERKQYMRQRLAEMTPEEQKQWKQYMATVERFTGPITANVKAMSPEQRKRYEESTKLWPRYYAEDDPEVKREILDEILGGKSNSESQQEDTPPVQQSAPPSFPEPESCTGSPVNVEEMTPEQLQRYGCIGYPVNAEEMSPEQRSATSGTSSCGQSTTRLRTQRPRRS